MADRSYRLRSRPRTEDGERGERADLLTGRPMAPGAEVFSVGALTARIKRLVEGGLGLVTVVGEVSNYRAQRSGHWYFSLKDADASLSCVAWRTTAARLRIELRDGLEVEARGHIKVYAPHGKYQLVVDHLEPKGRGALQAAFEALKQQLEKEGLFAADRKRPLPFLPRRIGVVTSPTGAAIRDFLRVVDRRHPRMQVLVAPARVQGDGAKDEVARQLARLDARGDCDVLVVTRGGGSVEDLWAFNEEVVARAIADCETPVVSAVGHERDVTIADLVADLRAATPSAAAELLVPQRQALVEELDRAQRRLAREMRGGLERERGRLAAAWGAVESPKALLADHQLELDGLRGRLSDSMRSRLRDADRLHRGLTERLQRSHPRARLQRAERELGPLRSRLVGAVQTDLGRARRQHAVLAGRLDALSPLRVLGRGYALVRREDGAVVRHADEAPVGTPIRIELARGRLRAEVTKSEPPADSEEGEV